MQWHKLEMPNKSIIIEIRNHHIECIGIAVEFLLANYKQDSIDLYLPNITNIDVNIVDFFIDNYKDIIKINLIKEIEDDYISGFFLTAASYNMIEIKPNIITYMGIVHNIEYDNSIDIPGFINLTITYSNKIFQYIPIHFRMLMDKTKIINMASQDIKQYNNIKYFINGFPDMFNLDNLDKIAKNYNIKILFIYKRNHKPLKKYNNIIYIKNINIIDLFYLYLTKKFVFYSLTSSSYNIKSSGSFHLAASFQTPFLIPENLYNIHNLKQYPNFIPFNSDNQIIEAFKKENKYMVSFRKRTL